MSITEKIKNIFKSFNPNEPRDKKGRWTDSGGFSGGILDKTDEEQDAEAKKYYETIRNRKGKSDITAIAKNTGFSEENITLIRSHIFEDIITFADGRKQRFDPSIDIRLAWQRLERNEFNDNDILLLQHELKELTIMKEHGYNYDRAHLEADLYFPWEYKIQENWTDDHIQSDLQQRITDYISLYGSWN